MWYSCIPQPWQDDSHQVLQLGTRKEHEQETMKQWLNSGGSRMRSNIREREAPHMVKNSRASRIYQTGRGIPGSSRQGRGILRIYLTGRGILGYTRQGRTRAYITPTYTDLLIQVILKIVFALLWSSRLLSAGLSLTTSSIVRFPYAPLHRRRSMHPLTARRWSKLMASRQCFAALHRTWLDSLCSLSFSTGLVVRIESARSWCEPQIFAHDHDSFRKFCEWYKLTKVSLH